jgi:hypothetical protein
MERISATFDERTLAAIRRVAGRRGVSRFLQVAARERLARLELLGMLDELDRKYGPVPDAVTDQVAREARRIFKRRRP